MNRLPVRKIARLLLAGYVAALTLLVILAVTVGPFQESYHLWTETSALKTRIRESERERKNLGAERDRLLAAVKKLQVDWVAGRETIRALRELTKNPEGEQRLLEANRYADKLSQERAVLIAKLNELRPKIEACENEKKKNP